MFILHVFIIADIYESTHLGEQYPDLVSFNGYPGANILAKSIVWVSFAVIGGNSVANV